MKKNKYKIFVSGSWIERTDAKRVMRVLESNGHTITEDWTVHEGTDSITYAMRDRLGVFNCDVYVLNNPKTMSRGKYVELGMAIALRKPIVVIGRDNIGIFEYLKCALHVRNVEGVVHYLDGGLLNLHVGAPHYIVTCFDCKNEMILDFHGDTGILDCPKCGCPRFAIHYESGKAYRYETEEDTPGVKKLIRVEEKL